MDWKFIIFEMFLITMVSNMGFQLPDSKAIKWKKVDKNRITKNTQENTGIHCFCFAEAFLQIMYTVHGSYYTENF